MTDLKLERCLTELRDKVLVIAHRVVDGSITPVEMLAQVEALSVIGPKKGRCKTKIPVEQQCVELCLKGEQCSRSRQANSDKCKIHNKPKRDPVPDGMVRKVIWRELINGIWYFICSDQKVYSPEDVMKNTANPTVIGTWEKVAECYSVSMD